MKKRMRGVCVAVIGAACACAGAEPAVDAGTLAVRATRLERSLTNTAAAVSVVDARRISESGALTIDAALLGVSGLDHQSHGLPGAGVKVDFRGMTPDFGSKSVLVVSEGRRLNEAFQGGVEFGQIPAWSVERVTALKGPASYAYGSGAMSGVVELEMKSGRNREPFGEYRLAGGNYGTWESYLAGGGQFETVDAFALAGHVQTDGYRPYPGLPRLAWRAEDALANIGWSPDENDAFRFLTGYYNGRGADREGDRTVRRLYQTGNWDHAWDVDRENVLRLRGYNTEEHSVYALGPFAPPLSHFPIPQITRDYRLRTTGADLSETWRPRDEVSVLVGVDFRQEHAALSEADGRAVHTENIWGGFVEADLAPADRLLATFGMRIDKNESFEAEWSPRAALIYRLLGETDLYASVGKAFRTPGFSDRFIDTTSVRWLPGGLVAFPFTGNPDLRPSTVIAYEVGVRQRVVKGVSWSGALFYNDISDAFDFFNGTIQNAAQSHTAGVELQAACDLGGGFEATADFSYTEGEIDRHLNPALRGKTLANLAPIKVGAGLAWRNGRQAHGMDVRFTDERFANADNTATLDPHLTVDWHSRYAFTPQVALTLTVSNLLDEDYRVYDHVSSAGYPVVGRRVMVGVEGRF